MTIQTDQTAAALTRAPSHWDQRKPGVRRTADLTGWARIIGDALTEAAR